MILILSFAYIEKDVFWRNYKCCKGLFHVKRTLLFSQRVKIQLLPIHSKHMVLWPSGCTKLSSKILERGIIVNILKSSLKFSMEKCTASGEDILFNQGLDFVPSRENHIWFSPDSFARINWFSFYDKIYNTTESNCYAN